MNSFPIQHFSNFPLQFFRESLDTLLTPQNKKIATIAAIALTCLAALYLFCDCCCRNEFALLTPAGEDQFPDGTKIAGKFYEENYSYRFRGMQTDFDGIIEEGTFNRRHLDKKMDLHGKGKRTYLDGSVWEGTFVNGEFAGKGTKILADGTIEEGYFSVGSLHGKGKVTIPKGDTIEGFFQNGKLNGYGKITHHDGTVEEGLFENGVITKRKPNAKQTTVNVPTASTKKADAFASSPAE
jgi:hypothetical protein